MNTPTRNRKRLEKITKQEAKAKKQAEELRNNKL